MARNVLELSKQQQKYRRSQEFSTRNRIIVIAACVLVTLFLIPCAMISWNNVIASFDTASVNNSQKDLSLSARTKMLADARDYDNNIDNGISLDNYYSQLLEPGSSPGSAIGSIHIAKIGVQLPIHLGTDAHVLDYGVGHVRETHLPIGGEDSEKLNPTVRKNGHLTALSAHNGIAVRQMFDDIDKLVTGDEIEVIAAGQKLVYVVAGKRTADPNDAASALKVEPGRDKLVLITCSDLGVNADRVLVDAYRKPDNMVDTAIADADISSNHIKWVTSTQLMLLACAAVVSILAFIGTRKW